MARPAIKKMELAHVEYIAYRLAQELMGRGEPIPPFDTRYPDRLESCLKTPFQTFQRKSLYKTFELKASILFYLLIKNHPFQNGNKRVAVMALLYFLYINNRVLRVDNKDLYEFSRTVAASDASLKECVVQDILNFLNTYIEKIV